jgi:hypothetical protein
MLYFCAYHFLHNSKQLTKMFKAQTTTRHSPNAMLAIMDRSVAAMD